MAEEHPPRRSPSYEQIDPARLAALRRQQAFATQAELAAETGMSRSMISLLETGKRRHVSPDSLRRLCQALGCQPGDILIQEGNNARPPTDSRG